MRPEPRATVVVGAGFAGLAAALASAARGDRVTVLERTAAVGGRAARRDGDPDPTAARIVTSDAALLAFVRTLGLAARFLPVRPVRAARAAGGRARPLPAAHDARAAARAAGAGVLGSLRLARLPRLLARYRSHLDAAAPERAAPLDDRSLADFGALYFGSGVVRAWMEPWLAERAPLDEQNASRAAFLLRWARERDAVAGVLGATPAELAEAAAVRLDVRTGAVVRAVEPAQHARLRVALESGWVEADAVVLAVPAPEAAAIAEPVLTAAERTILAAVRYDAAITWRAPARPGFVSDSTRIRVGLRGATCFASIALDPDRVTAIVREPWASEWRGTPDDVVAKEIAAAVERLLPGCVDGPGAVHRFPLAWPRFDVGALRALARLRAVEADRIAAGRPLWFAGDWRAAPTLDGAIASARAAGSPPRPAPAG